MKRFMTVAAAVAVTGCSLAGAAHADGPMAGDDPRIKAVVVLIGANDYGLADIGPSAPPR